MRIKSIPIDEERTIAFFPDSMRFFEVNEFSSALLYDIVEGKSYNELKDIYEGMTIDLYRTMEKICSEQIKFADRSKTISFEILTRLVINISNACNMNCGYCYANGGTYGGTDSMMGLDILEKTLDLFYKKYELIEIIQLFGGEPTLNVKAIEYTCKYIKKNNKSTNVSMVTNGSTLTDELIEIIKEYGIYVTISIDCSEMHDILRPFNSGSGTYNTVKNNLLKLYREVGQPGQVEITYTKMHDDNGISIIELYKSLKKDLGIEIAAHIAPVCSNEVIYKLETPDRFVESINDYFSNLDTENKMHYSFVDRFLEPLKRREISDNYCGGGINTIAVAVNGNIYPCFYFIDNDDFLIGNVADENNKLLKEKLDYVRKKYLDYNRRESQKCENCFANTICFGCLGINYSMIGNAFESSEFHCEWVRTGLETTIKNIVQRRKNYVE